MSKKYKSTNDIFAEQRRQLLHAIIARQQELKRAQEMPQLEPTDIPGQQAVASRLALDDFMGKYPRRLKATKNRPPGR
ncbi:hypothetical protein MKI77_004484 [Escherichia coli]|nr:hypothetical protein [Escherichia coli]